VNKLKIYSQGELDGACFLYSVANAIRAVSGKAISRADWSRAVERLPFRVNEFLSGYGTGVLDQHPGILAAFAKSFAAGLRSTVVIEALSELSEDDLEAAIEDGGALIASVDNGEHWVAIVEIIDGMALCACSWEINNRDPAYVELGTSSGRAYNVSRPVGLLKLWKGPAFVLRRLAPSR
jgi:hypothetical protein